MSPETFHLRGCIFSYNFRGSDILPEYLSSIQFMLPLPHNHEVAPCAGSFCLQSWWLTSNVTILPVITSFLGLYFEGHPYLCQLFVVCLSVCNSRYWRDNNEGK